MYYIPIIVLSVKYISITLAAELIILTSPKYSLFSFYSNNTTLNNYANIIKLNPNK